MKEQDLCVRMSKAEFDAALATAVTYSHQEATTYEVGQMVFYNDSWFMKTNAKTSCNYSLGAGWKQVIVE